MFNRGEAREDAFAELIRRGADMDLGPNHKRGGSAYRIRFRQRSAFSQRLQAERTKWGLAFVVLTVAVLGGAYYFQQQERAGELVRKISGRKQTLEKEGEGLARLRQEAAATEQELADIRALQTTAQEWRDARLQSGERFLKLGQALNDKKAALRELDARRQSLVARVRRAAEGETLHHLTLADGRKLGSPRIRRITNDSLILERTDGLMETSWRVLPPNLVARFQLGDAFTIVEPEEPAPPEEELESTRLARESAKLERYGVDTYNAGQLEFALKERREVIARLKAEISEYRETAEEERRRHAQARRARKATIHDTLAEEAEAKAKQLEYQLIPLEKRVRELEKILKP